jgi:glucosyl-dolichyl phosphate glucuronosyltransferase
MAIAGGRAGMQSRPVASVVICTYNRSGWLDATLQSLSGITTTRPWEIIVVDNNSADETPSVIARHTAVSAVPVTYVFEPRQGKSHALNTGIARAAGDIVVFTDDDVEVHPTWLDEACDAFSRESGIDYVGGPVTPKWEAPAPTWFDHLRSDLWGTLAILDYGPTPFIFEDCQRVPLGVNMAVRRRLVDRVGGFHPELGRRGASLLGQEQAEFFSRARACGVRGLYVPGMKVRHCVPAARLTLGYFLRWWFWKGVSRARVDRIHGVTELGLQLQGVPHVAGVPRYVWGQIPRVAARGLRALVHGRRPELMRHVMHLVYCLGYIRACWQRGVLTPAPALAPAPVLTAAPAGTGTVRVEAPSR